MRKRVIILLTVCILTGVGLPQQGNALPLGSELIEKNGLTWLSPIWNQNISYSDMINRVGNKSRAYYGFRIAAVYEVLDLFNSLPLIYPYYSDPFSIDVATDDSRIFGPAFGMMDPFFDQFGWWNQEYPPVNLEFLGGTTGILSEIGS